MAYPDAARRRRAGWYTSLALDTSVDPYVPYISYVNTTYNDLRVNYNAGDGWLAVGLYVDGRQWVGEDDLLALDSSRSHFQRDAPHAIPRLCGKRDLPAVLTGASPPLKHVAPWRLVPEYYSPEATIVV